MKKKKRNIILALLIVFVFADAIFDGGRRKIYEFCSGANVLFTFSIAFCAI